MAQSMKVAIVDDEKDMRQSISQWLALSGFETETYPSAEDAPVEQKPKAENTATKRTSSQLSS